MKRSAYDNFDKLDRRKPFTRNELNSMLFDFLCKGGTVKKLKWSDSYWASEECSAHKYYFRTFVKHPQKNTDDQKSA